MIKILRLSTAIFFTTLSIFLTIWSGAHHALAENSDSSQIFVCYPGKAVATMPDIKTKFLAPVVDPGNTIVRYEWDYDGDGVIDSVSNISESTHYVYRRNGIYLAKFIVYDILGQKGEGSIKVSVGENHISTAVHDMTAFTAAANPAAKLADGAKTVYALIVWSWVDTYLEHETLDLYNILTQDYNVNPSNVIFLLDCPEIPAQYAGIVNGIATVDSFQNALKDLGARADLDDILLVSINCHGTGYLGYVPDDTFSKRYHGMLFHTPLVNQDGNGDGQDMREYDFEMSLFCGDNTHDMDQHGGLDQWLVIYKPYPLNNVLFRKMYRSHYNVIYADGTGVISDNDEDIDMFTDYPAGDFNKDGRIDTAAGEVLDYDGDGVPPYDPNTGEMDEGDWAQIDKFENDCHVFASNLGEIPFYVFDRNMDNKAEIDVYPKPGEQYEVNGTDVDNDGCIEGIDLNDNGHKDDWICINETIVLQDGEISDDEVAAILNPIQCGAKIFITNACYGGGFINDLSGPGTIVMSACPETTVSYSSTLYELINEAMKNYKAEADSDHNGCVSISEAFNYAGKHPHVNMPKGMTLFQFDDNGDRKMHTFFLPNEDDGIFGSTIYLDGNVADTLPPAISINYPHAGDVVGTRFTVKGSAADDVSMIGEVTMVVDSSHVSIVNIANGQFSRLISDIGPGAHTITVYASDGAGHSSSASIDITVRADIGPKLAALSNQVLDEGITLDLSIADPGNDPGVVYSYSSDTLPSSHVRLDALSGRFTWTPAYDQAGSYTVTFTASNGAVTVSRTINIIVNNVNRPPSITNIPDQIIDENSLLSFTVSANDPDGDILTYSILYIPVNASFDASTRQFRWTPSFDQAGAYSVTFTVSDGKLSHSKTARITVSNIDRPSSAVTVSPSSGGSAPDAIVNFTATYTDPDGCDDVKYMLFKVNSSDSNMGGITLICAKLNGYFVRMVNDDGTDFTDTRFHYLGSSDIVENSYARLYCSNTTVIKSGNTVTMTWSVAFKPSFAGDKKVYLSTREIWNKCSTDFSGWVQKGTWTIGQLPILAHIGNKAVNEMNMLSFGISATNPNGRPLIYSVSELPVNAGFDPIGRNFSWKPDYSQSGHYDVTFTVSDNSLSASETITITVNDVNRPPILYSIGNKTVSENHVLVFTILGSDPDNDLRIYSATGLPTGATFNPSTRKFLWIPTFDQAGTYNVTFAVSDGLLSVSETITITVNNVNRAPIINPIGNKTIGEHYVLSFNISGDDPDGDMLAYSASGLPSGASFDSSIKKFLWVPTFDQAGTYNATFSVSDGSQSASETIVITVTNVNRVPIITTIGDKAVDENQALSFTVSATDPDGDCITYLANVPAGASFSPTTRLFLWQPTYDQAGVYNAIFRVSDGYRTASETITITVNNVNRAPVMTAISNKTVKKNNLLSFTVSATDPDGNALTYSASRLPKGATFTASTRTFSWKPTAGQVGTHNGVRFTVSDGQGGTASRAITITVTQ